MLIQGGHYQVNRVNQTTIDWQKIRIQEKLADDVVDSGRVPRQVECELSGDLVDGHVSEINLGSWRYSYLLWYC